MDLLQVRNTHTLLYPFIQLSTVVCVYTLTLTSVLPFYNIFPSAPLWVHNVFTSLLLAVTTHTLTGLLIGSYVFVTLPLWHLTFSRSFPKCQLIIFTPCTISSLPPHRFNFDVRKAFLLHLWFFFFKERPLRPVRKKSNHNCTDNIVHIFSYKCIEACLIMLTLLLLYLYVFPLLSFIGCDYNKPASVEGTVMNMTGWFNDLPSGLGADFITSLTWCI